MAQATPALPARHLARAAARSANAASAPCVCVFLAAALTTIVISVFIVLTVLVEALSFLSQIDLSQLTGIGWFPRRGIFDVTTLLLGTLIVTAIAMVIATPVGLALGDLPRRVRHAEGCARPSSRSSRCWPGSRASCSGSSRSR